MQILQKQKIQSGATMETLRFVYTKVCTTIKDLLKGIDDSEDNLSSNAKTFQQLIEKG